jgi:hypothetical protein
MRNLCRACYAINSVKKSSHDDTATALFKRDAHTMKILLSAFSCSPKWGSESGVGWHWANELAREHQVFAITHKFFEAHLSDASSGQSDNLIYVYLPAPTFGMN